LVIFSTAYFCKKKFSKRWKLQQKCLIYCLCVSHTSTDYVSRFVNRCSINGLGKKYMFLFSFLHEILCISPTLLLDVNVNNLWESISDNVSNPFCHEHAHSILQKLEQLICWRKENNYYSLLQKYHSSTKNY
jgi:hypothetical protein